MKFTAEDIAKERLEKYLEDLFSKENAFPEGRWEFYSYLLDRARNHHLDFSGYVPAAYRDDEAEAKRRNAAVPEPDNAFHLPERKKGRHV